MASRYIEGPVSDFVKTCVDVPRFLGCCRECPNYNKRWSCPPYDFSVEALWQQYTSILLYEEKIPISKELQEDTFEQQELNDISSAILAPVKRLMTSELLAMESQTPGSRALFAGTCELCNNCSKENGKQCMHPNQMRYSIEALGGNISKAVQIYFDDKILWAADGHLPEYLVNVKK